MENPKKSSFFARHCNISVYIIVSSVMIYNVSNEIWYWMLFANKTGHLNFQGPLFRHYFWTKTVKYRQCSFAILTVPCKKTGLFGVFHTKYIHTTRVENHLKVMLNPPIFSQMLVLMWEAYQWVLVPKFSMVFELQAFKFESTKKSQF